MNVFSCKKNASPLSRAALARRSRGLFFFFLSKRLVREDIRDDDGF